MIAVLILLFCLYSLCSGVLSSSSDTHLTVVRYRKDQRPTTLPIQPFTFHHQFASKPPQPKPPLPLLTGQVSGMQAQSSSGSNGDTRAPIGEDSEDATEKMHRCQVPAAAAAAAPPPGSVRPSPLGSYSPVQLHGGTGSSTCSTCTSSPQPSHTLSCQLQTPETGKHARCSSQLADTPPPPSLGVKRGMVPPMLPAVRGHCFHHGTVTGPSGADIDTLSPLACLDSGTHMAGNSGQGGRTHNGRFWKVSAIFFIKLLIDSLHNLTCFKCFLIVLFCLSFAVCFSLNQNVYDWLSVILKQSKSLKNKKNLPLW